MYKKIYRSMCVLSIVTLVCTTALILCSSYVLFTNKLKDEIRDETILLSEILNYTDDDVSMLSSSKTTFQSKRVTLVDKRGVVLYDNLAGQDAFENHIDRPEIIEAYNSGIGQEQRVSETSGERYYYCAVRLDDGNIIRFAGGMTSMYRACVNVIVPAVILILLMYLFAALVAKRLTGKIIQPINAFDMDRDDNDAVYDELAPFVNKIQRQSKEIKEKIKSLKLQKTRLDTISQNMSEGLVVLDKRQRVLLINESARQIFDGDNIEIEDREFIYLTRNLDFEEVANLALDNKSGTKRVEMNDKFYQVFYSPVNEKKESSGAILLIFDISETAKIEQIRQEFSANVSHELKTPLTSVLGYAQLIGTGIAKQEDIALFAGKIEKEARHLISLINDIIELSKLDEERNITEYEDVDLYDVTADVMQRLQAKAQTRNINLSLEGMSSIVKGSLTQITEMVYNLCDNAIKYNKDGGSVVVETEGRQISIIDTGIGIAKIDQDRVFERFYRADKSHCKNVEGTGLGLSIVKHIAQNHNASVYLESQVEKGTHITIVF